MALKQLLILILVSNLFIACHGGVLGAAAGLFICTSACHAGYFTCLGGGGAGAGKKHTQLQT